MERGEVEKGDLNQLEIIDVTFLPFNLKIFVSFKYYRLYSYHYEDGGMEKGALDQLEIIDLCFRLPKFFYSNIIDYICIITTRDGEGSFKSIGNHRLYSKIDYIRIITTFIYPTEGKEKEF